MHYLRGSLRVNLLRDFQQLSQQLKHGLSKMGLIGSLTNFYKVNKFQGFDCPGCAWPDPDGSRTIAEFCENGAKAIADEGTKKRASPEFWSKWTVRDLSLKSDKWLNSQGRLTHPLILKGRFGLLRVHFMG